MPDQELLENIEDLEVRQYVRMHLAEMTNDILTTQEALEKLPPGQRRDMYAAGESYLDKLLRSLIPGWDSKKVKADIHRRTWGIFCLKSEGKGKPEERWKKIFDKDGLGTQITEAALVAAFGALGTAIGGAVGAFLGSAIGKALQEFIKLTVREELDQWVEGSLDKYCETIPG
jgi:hypothetical protein